jgi:hypothetical protein
MRVSEKRFLPSSGKKTGGMTVPRNVGKCKIKRRKIQENTKLTLNRPGQAPRTPGV